MYTKLNIFFMVSQPGIMRFQVTSHNIFIWTLEMGDFIDIIEWSQNNLEN